MKCRITDEQVKNPWDDGDSPYRDHLFGINIGDIVEHDYYPHIDSQNVMRLEDGDELISIDKMTESEAIALSEFCERYLSSFKGSRQ